MLNNTTNTMFGCRTAICYCPNCGTLVTEHIDPDGTIKMECPVCDLAMVSRKMGRRHIKSELFAPYGKLFE